MKKILLASLIALTLVATGSAMAWDIDVAVDVDDAFVDVQAETPIVPTADGGYWFGTTAGVHGDGEICIEGSGDGESGALMTWTGATGVSYATQSMAVVGCCLDCATEPCDECPDYVYTASSGATIDGEGEIFLAEGAHVLGNHNGQILETEGEGDFTAGMMSTLAVEGQEPVSHAMGAYGGNVGFSAFGIQGMNADDCSNQGMFVAQMCFHDEGCEGQECPPCPEC